jgi:hypothetical protein
MTPINDKSKHTTIQHRIGVFGAFGVKPLPMLAAFLFLTAALTRAQTQPPQPEPAPKSARKQKPVPENIEWIWQYTPDANNPDGRENELVQDLRFLPFLQQYLTAPQTFWGMAINGRYRSLANAALDHLSVPGKVLADENRYISISGCTVHFCPARGLLWVDLNGAHHLVVFAVIDWTKQGAPTSDPAAEYTLWVFPDDPLSIAGGPASQRVPPALIHAIARWAAQPLAGSGVVQKITHAILVDPDGTPHEVAPSALGVAPISITHSP